MNKSFSIPRELLGLPVAVRKDGMNYLERGVRSIVEDALYRNYSTYLQRRPKRNFITFEEMRRSVMIEASYTSTMSLSVWVDEEKFIQNSEFRRRLYTAAAVDTYGESYEKQITASWDYEWRKQYANNQYQDWFWDDVFEEVSKFIEKDFSPYMKRMSQTKNRR